MMTKKVVKTVTVGSTVKITEKGHTFKGVVGTVTHINMYTVTMRVLDVYVNEIYVHVGCLTVVK